MVVVKQLASSLSKCIKLVQVIKKYETELNEGASDFKEQLVESISSYIEEYIDEAMPVAAIEEATKNKTAYSVLNNLRSVLAVDSSLMNESVKEAIVDGKDQITELHKEFDVIKLENKHLKEAYEDAASRLVLEQKLSGFNDKKAAYLKKVLSDKSAKFITENFEYTARLFDKKEKEQMAVIREEAISNRTVKADAPKIVVEEKVKPSTPENPYLAGLDKMK